MSCAKPVDSLSIYATLCELTGLPTPAHVEGPSLVPLLENPARPWPYPAITTYDYDEFSVRDERYRYIRYIDGGEELYDHSVDPEEWVNLANDPEHAAAKARMATRVAPSSGHMVSVTARRVASMRSMPFCM